MRFSGMQFFYLLLEIVWVLDGSEVSSSGNGIEAHRLKIGNLNLITRLFKGLCCFVQQGSIEALRFRLPNTINTFMITSR